MNTLSYQFTQLTFLISVDHSDSQFN